MSGMKETWNQDIEDLSMKAEDNPQSTIKF